jgi:NADPH:quinone reductase-like Zn-dependent oxidoreductase
MGASTAWRGLFDVGGLEAGQTVLIHGAAGGIGVLAVQFAKWKGARVIATASTANVEFVCSLGADEVIDYGSTPFEGIARDVDVVLDTVGGEVQDRSWQVLKEGGILVETAGPAPQDRAAEHGVRTANVATNTTTELLLEIGKLIESGVVKPVLGRVFLLEEAAQAHAQSETGHGRGRIVLHIGD